MNKDSIYKLIGYEGEYSSKVKKAIRKLLKQYHPDCQGDEEIFKLINEVKKELETNNVSFKCHKNQKNNDYDDIDYDYCEEMIGNLELQKKEIDGKIKKNQEKLKKLNIAYRNLYLDILDKKGIILNKKTLLDRKKLQKRIIFLCFVLIGIFIMYILFNSYIFLIIFVLGILSIIWYLLNISIKMNKLLIVHKSNFNSYLKSSQEIQKILNIKIELQKKKKELGMELKKLENDLRFYHNLLKYR